MEASRPRTSRSGGEEEKEEEEEEEEGAAAMGATVALCGCWCGGERNA